MNNNRPAANRIFVYGTLMRGHHANHYLAGATCLGQFVLDDHAMYDLGAYPGIVEKPGSRVIGEVYEIPPRLWPRLDSYEGEGELYLRRPVRVTGEEGELEVQTYIYNMDVRGRPLLQGPWGSGF